MIAVSSNKEHVDTDSPNYLNDKYTLKSWFLTLDHKRVAILYLITILLFFILGGLAAAVLRLELSTPLPDFVSNTTYKKMYTLHGLVMIFFCMVPAVPAILGNFLIPLMVGAKNLAFPRINLLSWYLYLIGGLGMISATVLGGIDIGWDFYSAIFSSASTATTTALLLGEMSIIFVSLSTILVAVNFITTIHKMRAPGLTWFRLPIFVWSMYATSLIILLGTPILLVALTLVIVDTQLQLGIFNPLYGGDPILFQHLFWFYGNQTAYVIILPAIGITFAIFSAFVRGQIFGYRAVVYAIFAITYLSFVTWARHIDDLSTVMAFTVSLFSFLTLVPFTVIFLSLIATLYKGRIRYSSPVLFVLGAIILLIIGGLAGIILSALAVAEHLSGTYFVLAHLHYAVAAALMAGLAGLHFWWPKLTGRAYPEMLAKVTAVILFLGANLTVMAQFILGYLGMPRHVQFYPEEFTILHLASTFGASIWLLGYLLPVIYLTWTLFAGRKVDNPWQAKGLEWEYTASPPHTQNFLHTPTVGPEMDEYPSETKGTPPVSQKPVTGLSH